MPRARALNLSDYAKPQYMDAVLHKYGFRDWDSVLAAIGHGGLKEGQVFNKLVEAYDKREVRRTLQMRKFWRQQLQRIRIRSVTLRARAAL